MSNPFTSARLVYRAIEVPSAVNNNDQTDVKFAHQCHYADPIGRAQANRRLLRPEATKKGEEDLGRSGNCLLGLIVCLKADQDHLDFAAAKPVHVENATSKPVAIGTVHLRGIHPEEIHHRTTEIGICLLPEYRGRGYGSETINWVLDWAFRHAGMHRVEISCVSYNAGAYRLYQRLGFKPEGRRRACMWYDGDWHDRLDLGMLEDEWRALSAQGVR